MYTIETGDKFELQGGIVATVISRNKESQTLTIIYEGGATNVMFSSTFFSMIERKLESKAHAVAAGYKETRNWAAC